MKKLLFISVAFFSLISFTDIKAETITDNTFDIVSAADTYYGDVYVQDENGSRALAQIYGSNGRIYCIFRRVVQRGSNPGPSQKYWASRSRKRGFSYEVYYNGKTWYFNL